MPFRTWEQEEALLSALRDASAAIERARDLMGNEDPAALARAFCRLDDDGQARFFVEAARIMAEWPGAGMDMQAHYIGRHLRDCECSTPGGRDLVRLIADASVAD